VDNQQHDGDRGINLNRTDRVPTLFASLVYAIPTQEIVLVFEDQRCQFE
jgi:hypothetical protein